MNRIEKIVKNKIIKKIIILSSITLLLIFDIIVICGMEEANFPTFLIFVLIIVVAFLVKTIMNFQNPTKHKTLKNFTETELEEINRQLEKGPHIWSDRTLIVTKDYIIIKKGPVGIYDLKKLIWVYEYVTRYYGVVPIARDLRLCFSNGKFITLGLGKRKSEELMESLADNDPDIVLGHSYKLEMSFRGKKKLFKIKG